MKRIKRFLKAGVVLCGLLGLVSSAYAFSATAGDLQGVVYADGIGGIDNVNVKIYTGPNETGTLIGTTTTATFSGIKGYYRFNNLPAALTGTTYYLSARDNQSPKRFADKLSEPVTIYPNQLVGHDIKVSANGKIQGVVNEVNGPLLNGAFVRINNNFTLTYNQAPVGNGYYVFNEIVPGTYTVIFAKAGYITDSKTVSLSSGETVSADMGLTKVSAISWSSQDGGKLDYEPFSGGIYRDNYYDYGPSIISNPEGTLKQAWWCGPKPGVPGDRIFYSTWQAGSWSLPQVVLGPENTWAGSSGLIADPGVIKGNFTYLGTNYKYAMYFTGTTDPGGGDNRVGVVFSNDSIAWTGPSNPIILPEGTKPELKWGAGMPSAYQDPATGTIWLVYLDSTADTGNKIRLRKSTDGIIFSSPLATQLDNPDGTHGGQQGPDIAFDLSLNKWYAVTKDGLDTVVSIWRTKNTGLDGITGSWELIGQIDSSKTQQVKNHNPGIYHLDNGNIYVESTSDKRYIAFGCGYGEAGNNFGNESWDIHIVAYTPVKQEAPNQPPVLNPIGNKTVNEGELLQFIISASDPDGNPLAYSASNLPSGATFNASTRTFSWTPTFSQAGTYVGITLEVSDGSLTDSESITITVNDVVSTGDLQGVVYADGVGGINNAKVYLYTGPNETGTLLGTTTTATVGTIVGYYRFNGLAAASSGTTYYLSARDNQTSKRFFDKVGDTDAAVILPNKLNGYDIKVIYDKTAPTITNITDSPDPFNPEAGQYAKIAYTLGDNLSTSLKAVVYIYKGSTLIRTLGTYNQNLGANVATWDGKNSSGYFVRDGSYKYRLKANDSAGNSTTSDLYPVTKK